jgi:UDP-glucose 4-epimerase
MSASLRRRAVIIGAAGFIGSALARALAASGDEVVGFVRPAHDATGLHAAGVRVVAGDAAGSRDVESLLLPGDVVYHFAGRSGAAASLADPAASLAANCGTLLTVLEAASRLEPRPRIVFLGSRLQYGAVSVLPVGEDHPQRPTSPYGLHKTFCEGYLDYYKRRHGIGYAVARATNPYGGEIAALGKAYNVLDQVIVRATRGETVTIYGNGEQIRDYVHIDDLIAALRLLAGRSDDPVVNVGSGIGIAFRDAVAQIVSVAGGAIAHVPWPQSMLAVETGDFIADIRAARALGYAPRVGFDDGIARSIARLRALA